MSLRTLLLLSPFVLAVLLGRAAMPPDESGISDRYPENGPMHEFSLKRYEWHQRPFMIFAPSEVDIQYLESMIVWNRNETKLLDRDLVLIEVFEDGMSRSEGREIPQSSAEYLRERFEVPDEAITVILIGKDGIEKDRWDRLPPLQELYDLIDTMPMRQWENLSRQASQSE